jgi:hypothetical protein
MIAPRSVSRVVSVLAIACSWLCAATPAAADSILAGTITDKVTGQPVGGAEVQIEYSGQALGSGTTDIDGIYSASFAIPQSAPQPVNMIATVRSPGYETNKTSFQVQDENKRDFQLSPLGVSACLLREGSPVMTERLVIVGHFLSPIGKKDVSDLSVRVVRSLEFALNTRLQTVWLPEKLQPHFVPCDEVDPKTSRLGAPYARALRADAFISGDVADAPPKFTLNTYVSDAYDLWNVPVTAINKDVDLNNPSESSMAGETHAAVLAAIAAGFSKRNDCISAIAVLSVAEQLVDKIPSYVTKLRKDCEARLPNSGLARVRP